MRKNVLKLPSIEAKKFFLRQESYITLDLPSYFVFDKVLNELSVKINGAFLSETEIKKAKHLDDIDYVIIGNKDGRYAWRKFDFINPLIYVSLINVITEETNWKIIKDRFIELSANKQIRCLSVPVISDNNKTSQKASQINEWVGCVEKESIRLALEFEYMYQTDISDCYGSIYTHSLAWAIHGKPFSKAHRGFDDCCGNLVDHHLQAVSNGQTNGIPQGSLLMDFLAEILLAYADNELFNKINSQVKSDSYRIIRYRDDYRIFVRDQNDGELIIKAISEVLSDLGLHLNTSKTCICSELILNSIKPDKVASIGLLDNKNVSKASLRNDLLKIYKIGNSYPNSGSVKTLLNKVYKIYEKLGDVYYKKQEKELISILTNIGYYNPGSFPIVAAFISKILKSVKKTQRKIIIGNVFRKLGLLPNSGLLEIWIQRISYPNKINITFTEDICKKINNRTMPLFNTSWIGNSDYKKVIEDSEYIDDQQLTTLDTVISSKEIDLFTDYYDGSR